MSRLVLFNAINPITHKNKIGDNSYFLNLDDDISLTITKNREGYEIWRYLLWGICILIIIEMLLSNVKRKT